LKIAEVGVQVYENHPELCPANVVQTAHVEIEQPQEESTKHVDAHVLRSNRFAVLDSENEEDNGMLLATTACNTFASCENSDHMKLDTETQDDSDSTHYTIVRRKTMERQFEETGEQKGETAKKLEKQVTSFDITEVNLSCAPEGSERLDEGGKQKDNDEQDSQEQVTPLDVTESSRIGVFRKQNLQSEETRTRDFFFKGLRHEVSNPSRSSSINDHKRPNEEEPSYYQPNHYCHFFPKGLCKNGARCKFFHDVNNHRKNASSQGQVWQKIATTQKPFCISFQNGVCAKGALCSFDHVHNQVWAPRNKSSQASQNCDIDHNGKPWQLASISCNSDTFVNQLYKTKMCWFNERRCCSFGETCEFAHTANELR
jgi:hypothetical protein